MFDIYTFAMYIYIYLFRGVSVARYYIGFASSCGAAAVWRHVTRFAPAS